MASYEGGREHLAILSNLSLGLQCYLDIFIYFFSNVHPDQDNSLMLNPKQSVFCSTNYVLVNDEPTFQT